LPVYLLLGVVLLVGLVLLARWFVDTDPKRLAGTLKLAGITAALAVVLFVLFRGEFGLIAGLAALLYPFFARWRRIRDLWRSATGPAQTSRLETAFLRVELDHPTGAVTGEVIQGRHAGRRLEDLGLDQLLEIYAEAAAADPASAQVLETYLDRVHGDRWRERAETGSGAAGRAASGAMSRDEAWRVLGLQPGAGEEQIREAHRRLMLANHPDRGGSTYLAAQINQAKDVLLGMG
jgi:hypothetical protein